MRTSIRFLSCLFSSLAFPFATASADSQSSAPPSQIAKAPDAPGPGPIRTFDFGAKWEAGNHVTQGSRVGDTVYVAGQFSHDAAGTFVGEGDVARQTRQTFANLDTVLEGLGASKKGILELEVFLVDPAKNHDPFIEEYKRYVGDGKLTVTLIGVTALYYPQELVEIRAVAHAGSAR